MSDRNKKYSIGLDIGTNSVGWAVTDDNYNLLKAKKKNLWGTRLFTAANTAADRRVFRSTRRRYRRRKNRINWLNEIFSEELAKVDPSFLLRLQNSWVSKNDSTRTRDQYNLFIDKNYTDVNYHHEFPTIYHLRKRLIEDTSKADIRLVYLALHNILKYRGNFTYEHQKFDVSNMDKGLTKLLENFNSQLMSFGLQFPADTDFEEISELLLAKSNPTSKIRNIIPLLGTDKDAIKTYKIILTLILGNKANLTKLFALETEEKQDIELSSSTVETKLSDLDSVLTDEQFNLIDSANSIYSAITLNDILMGETYLSFAKVRQYCDHKKDLAKLKQMWQQTSDKKAVKAAKQAYAAYSHSGKKDIQDFYKDMGKFLEIAAPEDLANEALQKIEDKTYLLKQRTNENGVIPFQLNENEMKLIIENQAQYYPFLKENENKLLSILSFRIPYYVGPLQNDGKNQFAWMEKKVNEPVRPWNFDDVVDREKSSNKFIKRMTSTDSYLIGEPVLPKMSLIYQKYEVLSELNNLRVSDGDSEDEVSLKVDVKQRIFDELFKTHRSVSSDRLKKWLINQSYYVNPTISGLADKSKFNSSLSTYHDFKKIFGEEFVNDPENLAQLEQLVEWLTIFEDKQILKLKLNSNSFAYTPEQIKKISNMRYQGWGRLSKKLLTGLKTEISVKGQPTKCSILDIMWNTNRNFISTLKADKYDFNEQVESYNLNKAKVSTPQEMVDEIKTSPALKRGISQSLTIIQELVKVMGHAPEHIFLEFTRETDISELTNSRSSRVNRTYKKIEKNAKKFAVELQDYLVPSKQIQSELRANRNNLSSDRLMLYFLQMGKSLYSDQPLDINRLSDYQIDHILPQTYIKDDSLENRALVLASENQHKLDDLLLDQTIINQNIDRWRAMKDAGLMGPKKFKNLTRTQVTEKDQTNFINRQLVQTSQIIKHVSNILNSMYGKFGTTCIETRANTATAFRKAFREQTDFHFAHPEFVKNRNVNDYHHAQDAYLACLLGLYQMRKFPTDNMMLVQKEYKRFFNSSMQQFRKKHHITDSYKNGFIISPLVKGEEQIDRETGEIIWNLDMKKKVQKIFQYKQFNVTRRTEKGRGEFYNQTVYPRGKGKLIPLKTELDPEIYGGYSGDNPAYIVLAKIDGKKNKLIKIPIRLAQQIDEKKISLTDYVEQNIKHKKSVEIIKSDIPLGQLIYSEKNGYLNLKSDMEITNSQQLVLPYKYVALLTLLEKNSEYKYDSILADYDDKILDEIFETIVQKMEQFYPYYQNERLFLQKNLDNFKDSNTIEKVKTLSQLLKFLHANSGNAELKFNNVKKSRFGRKSSGLNVTNSDLIYQSITGLFESRIHID
ncbi:type II CRISPR RNA-guided endonuclease Cas9 [Companilactobacillus sp. HBUAS56257]|uniref:type II CRISPR RNA-guided endonuclease Cas9 n=1 Tax=Companilactobacillus sp. HBUAS56257 TaxID=3109360 RepID=UPI002FF1E8EC